MLLSVVEPILVRERHVPLGILEPYLAKSVVYCAGDDVHVRERTAEVCDAAAASHEEGDEDDVRRIHAVVKEDANGHKSCGARADLPTEQDCMIPLGQSALLGPGRCRGGEGKMTYLRIEEKDPCVYRAVSFTDAIG